jgi:hypothetical protein
MSIRKKLQSALLARPNLVVSALGLGITIAIGVAIGISDHSVFAVSGGNGGDAKGGQ